MSEAAWRWSRAGVWGTIVITAAATFSGVFVSQMAVLGGSVGAAMLLAACAATLAFLVAPPHYTAYLFMLFITISHQFQSFAVIEVTSVELHPRELLLGLLLARGMLAAVQDSLRPAQLSLAVTRLDPIPLFVILYGTFFVYAAGVGLARGNDLGDIAAELRFAIFLLSYVGFAWCVTSIKKLRSVAVLVLLATTCMAIAGLILFCVTSATGDVITVQNAFGEFTRREVGGRLYQLVRPSGHVWFEICLVALVALFLSPGRAPFLRAAYLALMLLFMAAITITFMRTAWIALLAALALLVSLHLPRALRAYLFAVAGVVVMAGVVAALMLAGEQEFSGEPEFETSLRARFVETTAALDTAAEHPIAGAGLGGQFRALALVSKSTLISASETTYQALHNAWVYYLFKGGVIGCLLVLAGVGGLLWRGYATVQGLPPSWERQLGRGLLAALVGQLVASIAMPRMYYPTGLVFIALCAAAFVLLGRRASEQARGQSS